MSRVIALAALLLAPQLARADSSAPVELPAPSDEDLGQRGIGADIGLAGGGRVTPGGFRVAGHYLERLDEGWWFDGIAAFTFGSTAAGCFRDRSNTFVCDHAFADGDAFELAGTVRRIFAAQGQFRPFARAGVGIGLVRYSGDSLTGFAIPVHVGGGVRAQVSDAIAIVGDLDVAAGLAIYGHGLGAQPLLGFAVTAGTEFKL